MTTNKMLTFKFCLFQLMLFSSLIPAVQWKQWLTYEQTNKMFTNKLHLHKILNYTATLGCIQSLNRTIGFPLKLKVSTITAFWD